jgi:hypothetical protein
MSCSEGYLPSFTPVIYSLSVYKSIQGKHTVVYVSGDKFQYPALGITYVSFGSYKNLPIVFYSTTYISFVVPIDAPPGNYSVTVVNVYNGQFSPQINSVNSGVINISNAKNYSII